MDGVVFDIQHFAVHDGPGIRTLVFLKGCPLRCAWCCNPESQAFGPTPRLARGGRVLATPETCGWTTDAATVVARIAKDAAFYRNSGGGATFSGGEPLAQPAFLAACLAGCRDAGIHTAVGTCGHAPPAVLDAVAPLVDLWLFDLKIADRDAHAAATGVTNDAILANLRTLAARVPDRVTVRVPLVPGATLRPGNVEALADLARDLGLRSAVVAPYHSLGVGKYADFGLPPPPDPGPPSPADVAAAIDAFRSRGIACEVA